MRKRNFLILLLLVLAVGLLAGCGGGEQAGAPATEGQNGSAEAPESSAAKPVVLKVGVTPVPHGEIMKQVKPLLEKEGIQLEIVEFTDYAQINPALDAKEIDANYFQHKPYLESFNKERGTEIVSVQDVHFEPLGIYPGKTKALNDVKEGAVIAVPNDPSNEARALFLLQEAGLITLPEDADLTVTPADIKDNPRKLQIKEFDAGMLPRVLPDVDLAVINGNYAIEAGLNVKDALAVESADSLAAQTYANIIAVRKGEENREEIQKLVKAVTSPEIKKFIEEKYSGAVVPVFN
ncbi:MetQ/NlpA family ABC transporter substrate-binding protein [Bacillaceae bacterium]